MLFDFNQYSALLLPSFIQGVLFSIIFLWKGIRHERLADILLSLILLIYTFKVANWMLGFAGWYDSHDGHTTFMFYFVFNHWLAIGPLFYLYFLAITNNHFKWEKRFWWHFLPEGIWLLRKSTIFVADLVVEHWGKGNALPYFYETHGEWFENGWGIFDKIWLIAEPVSIFIYVYLSLRLYKRYKVYISQNFSDTGGIHFQWLRNILGAMALGYIVWLGFDIADLFTEDGLSYAEDWYSFFFLGILIYYLSLSGFANSNTERPQMNLHFEPDADVIENNSPNSEEEMAVLKNKIEQAMTAQKPYLHSDISLSQMAAQFNCSPATLSKAINTVFQKNFNEFINEYRVVEVKEKLADPAFSHLTILAIGFECGFSSKATFNRVFKKIEGVSPSEFMANVKK